MSVSKKVAVVTGAGQGLGRAIALRLARDGAHVCVAELVEGNAEKVAAEIKAAGGEASAWPTDVTQEGVVCEVIQGIQRDLGSVDILVNNAGLGQNVEYLLDLSAEEWNRVLAVNLTGTFLCCKYAGDVMARQESGAIVNISSLNGLSPAALVGAYNVAKAGVLSLTRTLAMEMAPYRVRVNAVCPGPVYTDFNKKVMGQRAQSLGTTVEDIVERVQKAVPLGRWGEPEDIANMVAFLVSEETGWITGEVFTVSGGLSGVSAAPAKKERP